MPKSRCLGIEDGAPMSNEKGSLRDRGAVLESLQTLTLGWSVPWEGFLVLDSEVGPPCPWGRGGVLPSLGLEGTLRILGRDGSDLAGEAGAGIGSHGPGRNHLRADPRSRCKGSDSPPCPPGGTEPGRGVPAPEMAWLVRHHPPHGGKHACYKHRKAGLCTGRPTW